MKFVIVVVMLAIALGAESSLLPYGPLHLGGGPALYHGAHAALAVHAAPAAVAVHAAPAIYTAHGAAHLGHYGAPAAVAVHAAPALHAAHAVAAAPAHGGTYVAKTRGAEHVAPLPGHIASATSVNVQPAPGTW